MKIKTILYKGSIILPIINNIYKLVKFIIEFNKSNSEIVKARDEILQNVKYLQSVTQEIKDFQRLNDEDYN